MLLVSTLSFTTVFSTVGFTAGFDFFFYFWFTFGLCHGLTSLVSCKAFLWSLFKYSFLGGPRLLVNKFLLYCLDIENERLRSF